MKAPPTGKEDLLRDVDLLLVSPGLGEEQREASLAILEGTQQWPPVPVLTFNSAVEEKLFAEDSVSSWPVEIGGLAREIEAVLGVEAEIGPAVVANHTGSEAALP